MNYTKLSKNIICKILSVFISTITTLLITNLVVTKMNSEVYGFHQLSNDFINYAMVISVALNSMATRYISISYYKEDIKEANTFLNSTFYANIILGITLFIPLMILVFNLQNIIVIPSNYVFDVKILFLLMFINFLISICTSVFGVATFMKNRFDLDSFRNIESKILNILFLLVLYYFFTPKIWYLGVGTIVSTLYVLSCNVYYTKKLTPEVKLFHLNYFSITHVKTLIKSGIWNSFTKIGSIFLMGLDLLVANLKVGSYAMGILSVSKTLPKLIFSSMTTISSVFSPNIMNEYAKNDKESLVRTIDESIKINSFFSIIIEVIIIVVGKRIFDLWLPGQESNILHCLSVIAMLGYIVLMPFETLWNVFVITNKVNISSIYLLFESIFVIALVFILLDLTDNTFIKMIIIAGTSSVFEMIRGAIFLPIFSAICLKIPINTFYKPLLKVILGFLISLVISVLFNTIIGPVGWIGLFAICSIITLICIIVTFFCVLNNKERMNIKDKILIYMKGK